MPDYGSAEVPSVWGLYCLAAGHGTCADETLRGSVDARAEQGAEPKVGTECFAPVPSDRRFDDIVCQRCSETLEVRDIIASRFIDQPCQHVTSSHEFLPWVESAPHVFGHYTGNGDVVLHRCPSAIGAPGCLILSAQWFTSIQNALLPSLNPMLAQRR